LARIAQQTLREKHVTGKSSEYVVIASATAMPGKEADLEQALRDAAGPTRAQSGCVGFQLLRAKNNRATIVGFERWASVADHENHMKGEHVQILLRRMAGILAGPPTIVSYETVDG
jgi:quinol monooxygenase YgiN